MDLSSYNGLRGTHNAPRGKNANLVQIPSTKKAMFEFFETFKNFY